MAGTHHLVELHPVLRFQELLDGEEETFSFLWLAINEEKVQGSARMNILQTQLLLLH